MRKWEHFAVEGPRPDKDTIRIYKAKERSCLESLVGSQVAYLLASYGSEEEVELNIGGCLEVEEPTTYRVLQLEEEVLADGSEVVIGQLPPEGNKWDTTPGVYQLEHNDDNDCPILSVTVHDPSHVNKPLVHRSNGPRLKLNLLQEVHELLHVVTISYKRDCEPNVPLNVPTLYPTVAFDLEFQLLAAKLEADGIR